jgi:serine/threonine protein phosphatase 1
MIGRIYVIGDIHGALKALKQLIDKLPLQKKDQLIFIGDYVDGWSESSQVIDYLLQLEKANNCIFIKGNHDAWCERWLETGEVDAFWQSIGGQATMDSYRQVSYDRRTVHLDFFKKMKMYSVDAENRLFVHAGFTSVDGLDREQHSTDFYWDRTLWEMAVSMDPGITLSSKLYPKRLRFFKEIYIGHTPTTRYDNSVPMQAQNVWNVDTGAGFTGALSALEIHTKEYWQSDICMNLYPNEKGRNK